MLPTDLVEVHKYMIVLHFPVLNDKIKFVTRDQIRFWSYFGKNMKKSTADTSWSGLMSCTMCTIDPDMELHINVDAGWIRPYSVRGITHFSIMSSVRAQNFGLI